MYVHVTLAPGPCMYISPLMYCDLIEFSIVIQESFQSLYQFINFLTIKIIVGPYRSVSV